MSEEMTPPQGPRKIKCFVVIGFETKWDSATSRELNLDLTYEKLIKPAMDRVGRELRVDVDCVRAKDINVGGNIDELMYHWLYEADIVVADLSTLNANVFYELGVRFAQKPNTTLLIAEKNLPIPFDLSHESVYKYEHGGKEIDPAVAEEFETVFSDRVMNRLNQSIPLRDSPVYKHLNPMIEPKYKGPHQLDKGEKEKDNRSLAIIMREAKAANKNGNYNSEIDLYNEAIDLVEKAIKNGKPDTYLLQRLARAIYMAKDSDADDEAAIMALKEAKKVLLDCEPEYSTDPETLGLAGAIHKRLYDRSGDEAHLEQSMGFYERAYHVKQDYDNGINAALLYTLKALRADSNFDAIAYHGHGNQIRKRVEADCLKTMESKNFNSRSDCDKVVQTLALALLGLGRKSDADALGSQISQLSHGISMDIFLRQYRELSEYILVFNTQVNVPDESDPIEPPIEPPPTSEYFPHILGSILAVILVPLFAYNLMDTGEQGTNGLDGDRGEPGRIGPIGLTGANGLDGDNGEPGLLGPIGLTGANGLDGDRGEPGRIGPIGLTGPQGPPGPPGPVLIIRPELTSFAISKTEVTFAEYDKYVKYVEGKLEETGEKPSPLDQPPFDLGWTYDEDWGRGERPVMNVNWNDVQGYIQWLNETTGVTYRLPTAAEWEYAAIGAKNTNYSWENNLENCNGCDPEKDLLEEKTAEVRSYDPNPVGLYDMHGNVWEWVDNDKGDCYVLDSNGIAVPLNNSETECGHNPLGLGEMRGGSYLSEPDFLGGDRPHWELLTFRHCAVGFRLARDLKAGEIAQGDMVSFLRPDHAEFYNSIYKY